MATSPLAEPLQWAGRAFPDHPWASATLLHGAFHDVALAPDGVTLRLTIGDDGDVRAGREAAVLESLHHIDHGVATPRLLSGVVVLDGRAGYLTTTAPGDPQPPPDWPRLRSAYSGLLDVLASAPRDLALPPPRQWCGGTAFPHVVEQRLAPGLGLHLTAAVDAVQALHELPAPQRPVLVHGDFGAHNVLWRDGRATALIDWDHACVADPAMDLAPLVGAHGAAAVRDIASPEDVDRAMVHRATLPLQVAAAAELTGRSDLRDHALLNFVRRCGAGTLHDPDGTVPVRGSSAPGAVRP